MKLFHVREIARLNSIRRKASAMLMTGLLLSVTAGVESARAADVAGATAGELGVSPGGAMSYSIPITVP